MGKFCQFFTELSAHHTSVFSFLDDYLSNYQQIFTKPAVCIYIVEVWFGIANGKISRIVDIVICLLHDTGGVSSFHVFIYHTYTKYSDSLTPYHILFQKFEQPYCTACL